MDLADLKTEAVSWNLASDEKLLAALQKFSDGLTERTKDFVGKVDTLGFDVAESEVALRNTFNEFLMLGNSQFIENVRKRNITVACSIAVGLFEFITVFYTCTVC